MFGVIFMSAFAGSIIGTIIGFDILGYILYKKKIGPFKNEYKNDPVINDNFRKS